jgi:hypothetical protein
VVDEWQGSDGHVANDDDRKARQSLQKQKGRDLQDNEASSSEVL